MSKPSFRLDGIYLRTMNVQNEIEGYKPSLLERFTKTKVGNVWDLTHIVYEIVCFMRVDFYKSPPEYRGGYFFPYVGEIQFLADSFRNKANIDGKFDNIIFEEHSFSMENNDYQINGQLRVDFYNLMEITIYNKTNRRTKTHYYRFIQWAP